LAVAGMQGIIAAWLARRDDAADRAAEQAVADLSRALALLAEDGGR
ncbi:TetR family transcriptional regulator, partial [Clavibacter phaseoli]